MKTIKIGDAAIPLDAYVVGGTAILGIRESGKTYTAKGIAEQLLDYHIPIVVFDAIGVWRFLKTAGEGKGAHGYSIVVAGGKEPDLPLTPQSAPEIVRAAIRENIPLIIDLYDKRLSKSDWRKIVQSCFRVLLYENEGLRHIFLEETAEYAPQKVIDGETYAEVEKLVRMGGNASLGITLINQRAQEVNKAVLDLCENCILMRQRGAHAIDSLEKWMDRITPDVAKAVAKTMPNMAQGEAWVFTGSSETPIRTRSERIRTYHPDRRKPEARKHASAPADTSEFVDKLSKTLGDLAATADANDPKKLKARIAELERAAAKPAIAPAAAPDDELVRSQQQEIERLRGEVEQLWRNVRARNLELNDRRSKVRHAHDAIATACAALEALGNAPDATDPTLTQTSAPAPTVNRASLPSKPLAASPAPRPRSNGTTPSDLPKGERVVLAAIAQHPEGCDRTQIAVLTGYKESSRKLFVQKLRAAGFINGDWPARATAAGIAALGNDYELLPTGDALRSHWLGKLQGGERTLFGVLCDSYPHGLTAQALEQAAEYKASSRKLFLQKLAARKLIERREGKVFACAELFG